MSFNEVIMWIMAIGAIIGGIDRLLGNKIGLGEQFEEGWNSMGALALGMVGMVCLSPILAQYIGPAISPFLRSINADPAIFGSILPNDTGGYQLALSLASDKEAGLYSGLIVSSMLGCTIVFSIPVGLGLIEKKDQPYFAKGLLIGFITIPIGSFIGGLIAGYNNSMITYNTIPVAAISILVALGLRFIPNGMIKGCIIFGKIITGIITIGLVIAAFQSMTGLEIIKGMAPIEEGLSIVGSIAVVLCGTFPILSLLTRLLEKPLGKVGSKIGLDATSTAGLIFTLANSIPVYKMMKDMNSKGKIVNAAWLVPATAALGDHLGFTAGVYPDAIFPVVISKIIAGVLAVVLAMLMTRHGTELEDAQSLQMQQKVDTQPTNS